MKTKSAVTLFLVEAALIFSTIAKADTLPLGAVRFNRFTNVGLQPVDVPPGTILVITDIVTTDIGCTLADGPDSKIHVQSASRVHLQTGIDFTAQLHAAFGGCDNMTISGYWLDVPQ